MLVPLFAALINFSTHFHTVGRFTAILFYIVRLCTRASILAPGLTICSKGLILKTQHKEKQMELILNGLYKVSVTEYECGVQRVDPSDTKYFTTLEEAEKYKAHWETGGSRECYWRADIQRI
jgi:hypothetical protein